MSGTYLPFFENVFPRIQIFSSILGWAESLRSAFFIGKMIVARSIIRTYGFFIQGE